MHDIDLSKMNISEGVSNNNTNSMQRKTNQNIQVYVRVRPLNARERCIRSSEVIEVVSPREIVTRHNIESKLTKKFTFDRTFGPESKQNDVYSTVVAPLIEEVLSGYNCTVFAYGQTGTGKTYTMVGTECAELKSSWEDDSEIGIIPRALSHLFDELRLMNVEFMMRISYLELYNEELCDLLSSDDSTKIRIYDDSSKKGSVIIQGLEEIPVHSKDDVYKLLEKGKERRKTATTLMNAQSSRSHTVFSIVVHIRENGLEGEELVKIGKLNLVDLAGSENVSKAGNEKGIRVRETVNINQSLLTLGRVITALVERTPHIPYRESKLTRLLQESLGGRTKTSIIATISPGHKDIEETLSTLEYAHRAKNIQNKPEVNQKLNKRTILKEYSDEIDKLKRDLAASRDKNGVYLATETYNEMLMQKDAQNRELNEKMLQNKALRDELANKEKMINETSRNLIDKTVLLKEVTEQLTQTKGQLLQTKKTLHNTNQLYKEKKLLLQTHMNTENMLREQATQLMQVADIATNDTEELHGTIERRKHVEQKIQTACERFVERMYFNFEHMDNNIDTYNEQHKMQTNLLMDEFVNCTNVQTSLVRNSKDKIVGIKKLCIESEKHQSQLNEEFINKLNELSEDHRETLSELYTEMRSKGDTLQAEIVSSLSDMETYHEQQKQLLESMRSTLKQQLETILNDSLKQTQSIQQQLTSIKLLSEANLSDLSQLNEQISQERMLADKEKGIIKEFVQQMEQLQQERSALTDNLNIKTTSLESNSKDTLKMLQDTSESTQSFQQLQNNKTTSIIKDIDMQINNGELYVGNSIAKCAKMRTQLDCVASDNVEKIQKFQNVEETHCVATKDIINNYTNNLKRKREYDDEQINSASKELENAVADEVEKLKAHVAVSNSFTTEIQKQNSDYAEQYKNDMNTCKSDLAKFKQSELQTYVPTGQTPSKREFAYPRMLAATSPHTQIIKRYRIENDWSDLDMTVTIDEEASDGDEDRNLVTELSQAETVFNSTPIELANVTKRTHKHSNPAKLAIRNSSTNAINRSPSKTSQYLSPVLGKENKENTL